MMEKEKALEIALSKIEKDFGKGAIMKLGDAAANISVSTIPSGCLQLDYALGVGGLPRGRIIEIYGPESSGKTTLALHAIAEAQKLGGTAAFIDAEHALDPVYAHNLGVDVDNLYISQPDSGEDALEICDTLVRSGAIDIIVVDSVAALVPKAELEGDMGDSHVGLQARLMSQALRKLTGVISKTNTIIIFINQLREKVGVMFGNPETTTGGKALKFYASVRMEIVKNKVAPPFKTAEFDMIYGEGISRESCILDMAVDQKIINKTGAWYSYNDMRMAQGRDNARLFLKDNKELCDEIEARVREKMMQSPAKTEEPEDEI